MAAVHTLIVEDEEDLADLYAAQLSDVCSTSVAYDGERALEILDQRGENIDVVLLDRRMPDVSGDDILETITEQDLECAVAMVTAVDPDFDIVQMGFDDYLTKPIREEELRDTVERLGTRPDYDEHVRDHLALLSKKTALEADKPREELTASREYIQLEKQILNSRLQLDAALPGDVFIEVLLEETGKTLSVVLQYDDDSWQYRYVDHRVEEQIATINSELTDILEQFRQEGRQNSRFNAEVGLGGYYSSVHYFASIILIHFYHGDDRGIICGFDPEAAPHLTDFVSFVNSYLERAT